MGISYSFLDIYFPSRLLFNTQFFWKLISERDLLVLIVCRGFSHWKSHLEDLTRSKNSNRDLVTGQFPYDVLVEYLQSLYIKDEERKLKRTQRLRKAHERRRERAKRLEGRLRKFRGRLLREGVDHRYVSIFAYDLTPTHNNNT